ncbi:hypothetical protein FEM48_Zijuj09G0178900 [Ziziphus jujuba var. spinosa]|uniref:Uncharacterized protein n=1 Tax=Ziziphus jujuba var. spinosa TaxID=714518 RepID=A0A978UUF5_ZIZJJ|nr:hypothetical protein FEM48_Zijuj09G0178900 [Ziziphus jujuba var. spinosa]
MINREEAAGGEFYEKIEAPKFVDFTLPDQYRPDDGYWFCLRVAVTVSYSVIAKYCILFHLFHMIDLKTSTIAAYQEAFERLLHQVDGLLEAFLTGCFIAGVREDIRLDVKIKHPYTLAETIEVARVIEERNQFQRKPVANWPLASGTTRVNNNPNAGLLGLPPNIWSTPTTAPPLVRQLSSQEAREGREKGLCYYCDEKFMTGHRCERPQLFIIEETNDPILEVETDESSENDR